MDLRSTAIGAAFLLGAVAFVAGLGHWVAVTVKAMSEDRGYDLRLADMLAIGFLPVGLGAMMLWGAWLAQRGDPFGLTLAALGATVFSLVIVVLWPGLTAPPEGSMIGTALGLVGFVATVVLNWMAK